MTLPRARAPPVRISIRTQASRDKKIDAVKKVIANMTVGKDVSMLFTDVLNCIQTGNIELKKLVYLYLINYARTHPDMALLAVNTFVKDAADPNPLVRALAIRTMGCIRVERITEYLCEPLAACVKDGDPYVRKTAALCVAKLYDIQPELVVDRGFVDALRDLVADPNPTVVANAVAALTEISEASNDDDVMKMSTSVLQKLLAALNECTEWGQVSILDALAKYVPAEAKDAENIVERVLPRLQHANSAVVMSAVKVILQYMYAAMDVESELCAGYRKKLAPPLVTLVNGEPEMCYVALRNINLIVQRDRRILENEIKVFFCKYNDPIYVKLEKLEIMIRLVSEKNVDQVLLEFKEYAQEVDIDFVRRAVRAIGRCAVKLDKAAQRCVNVLLELIQTKVNYVVMEAVVVVKDIFRKYPNRYESVIGTLCENLESLDEPDAKASMIWIIGEYADQIENADELLETFLESFAEEEHAVQLQLLTATVKLFLKQPNEGKAQEMVQSTLDKATTTSDNPDLRDRGFIYWRLLSTNPDCAKAVVLGEKPAIQDDTDALDDDTLEDLLSKLATLASVYHKPPAAFVLDGDAAKDAAEGEEEEAYDDFDDADGGGGGGDEPPPAGDDDLSGGILGGGGGGGAGSGEIDLLDMGVLGLDAAPPPAAPAAPALGGGDLLGGGGVLDAFAAPPAAPTPPAAPVARPKVLLVQPGPASGGVGLKASIGPGASGLSFDVEVQNGAPQPLRMLQVQCNKSPFGIAPQGTPALQFAPPVLPGGQGAASLPLAAGVGAMLAPYQGPAANAPPHVVPLQIAFKNADTGAVFYGAAPVDFDALWAPDGAMDRGAFIANWKAIDDSLETSSTVPDLPTGASIEAASAKLSARNAHYVARRAVPNQPAGTEVAYFSIKTAGGAHTFLVELTFKQGLNACKVCVKTSSQPFANLAKAAVERILRAP